MKQGKLYKWQTTSQEMLENSYKFGILGGGGAVCQACIQLFLAALGAVENEASAP